jgi:hypothetical protein
VTFGPKYSSGYDSAWMRIQLETGSNRPVAHWVHLLKNLTRLTRLAESITKCGAPRMTRACKERKPIEVRTL